MTNDFSFEEFASKEACENRFEEDIMTLSGKWQKVIELLLKQWIFDKNRIGHTMVSKPSI